VRADQPHPRYTIADLFRVRSGRADIAMVSTALSEPELTSISLRSLTPVVVLPANDPLVLRKRISINHLAENGVVTLPPDSPFRIALERAFAAGGQPLRVRCEARTQAALLEFVHCGVGRAVVHKSPALEARRDLALRPLDAKVQWPVVAVVQACDAESAALKQLLAELTKAMG
jgi:LysR substrate binding domain